VAGGAGIYGHLPTVPRAPASNEKLLLSMSMLDRFGAAFRIATEAASSVRVRDGVLDGDLVLMGQGDPELGADDLQSLAIRLRDAGLTRVTGSVVGDTTTFRRDRRAPGWHPIALRYIGLPTALSFEGNVDANGYVFDPERRAAAALAADLRELGIRVEGEVRSGPAPAGVRTIAAVRSAPLEDILGRQNVSSINLDAETLSKLLATDVSGRPGSIAQGAEAIEGWANALGADATLHDACGLSYADRVTAAALAALLDDALRRPWGDELRASLAAPGEGTLGGRLAGLPVRAKTGTLIRDVSALSGYVRLRDGRLASFSILSRLPKDEAVSLEDSIVRAVAARG
jgi:serine-type D-Ala-D-Ala carboxypeptidase/endopeptidase (penicillin-binding protein 4)